MRALCIGITILMNSVFVFGQLAEFSFDKKLKKFDATEEGIVLKHSYHFENKGDAPLIISNYEVACKCTKVTYPKDPIPPGGQGTIEMSFDSDKKIGWQYRTIKLFANTKKSPTELEFRVKVIPKE